MHSYPRAEKFCARILERFPSLNSALEILEEKTGKVLPKEQILLIIISIIFGLLVLFFGSIILTISICVVYPALKSVRAIDGCPHNTASFWLKYWTLYSFVSIFEILFRFIIFRIPHYFLLKIIFFFWCSNSKGADVLYNYLSPFIRATLLKIQIKRVPIVEVNDPVENEQTESLSRQLRVLIKNATNLKLSPGFENLSPYCVLELKPKNNRKTVGAEQSKFKTKCKENTQNPIWAEALTFFHLQRLDANLIITIFDKQTTMNDRKIGSIEIDLENTISGNITTFDLFDEDECVGQINIDYSIIEF